MKKFIFICLAVMAMVLLGGCSKVQSTVSGRWYTQQQLDTGAQIFADNCAACHGKQAQGAFSWQQPQTNGKYPPPPLNGKGHTWHHPLLAITRTINNGGILLGGSMPAFKGKLHNDDIASTIAYIQSFWPDNVYLQWERNGGLNRT